MNTFGERLRLERERLKLSQTAFAEVGGVQKNAQINYEKDQRAPDADYLAKLSSIGVDVAYLLTGQRNENAANTPIELSYLRICRALPDQSARMAGNAALIGLLSAYGNQLSTYGAANDTVQIAAQNLGDYDASNKK